jgi:hypothetical protein
MKTEINLCPRKAGELVDLLKKIDKKSLEYRKFLVKVDPVEKEVNFVAGNATLMKSVSIDSISVETEDQSSDNVIFISFDADVLLDALADGNSELDILLQSEGHERVEMTFPKLTKLRRAFSKEVENVHLEHFNILGSDSVTQCNKDNLLGLVRLVDEQCQPFECVLLNSDKNNIDSVKVQRNGEVFSETLGTKTHLGIEICLDKKTINILEDICESSDEEDIGLRIEHDSIIFKLKDSITSVSIPDHSEFLSKIVAKKEVVISFILDAYKLKAELSSYVSMHDIKQQEQSYLFFFKEKLIVCAKSESLECADMLDLIAASSNDENLVLMVNLHLFKDLKVKDVTEFHKLKASIIKSVEGEYSFSFFHSEDPLHAFFSVPCIYAPSHLTEVKKLYGQLKKQLADQKKKPIKKENKQLDLVGFEELLDV